MKPLVFQGLISEWSTEGGYWDLPTQSVTIQGGYPQQATLHLTGLPKDAISAAHQDRRFRITVEMLKPKTKIAPWKLEEVPLGCYLRERSKPNTLWLVTRADQLNPDASVWSGQTGWGARGLAADYEHSTDGGKTWKPAGRVEEVYE